MRQQNLTKSTAGILTNFSEALVTALTITALLLSLIFGALQAEAQSLDSRANTSRIQHTPPTSAALPAPGTEIELLVRLGNPSSTKWNLSGIATRDGSIFPFKAAEGVLNENYELVFKLPVISPSESLRYSFVLEDDRGNFLNSEEYSIARECRAESFDRDTSAKTAAATNSDVVDLAVLAKSLETEIQQRDTTLRLISKLKEILGNEATDS